VAVKADGRIDHRGVLHGDYVAAVISVVRTDAAAPAGGDVLLRPGAIAGTQLPTRDCTERPRHTGHYDPTREETDMDVKETVEAARESMTVRRVYGEP